MPVLKHAKKKLRQDVKRTRANKRIRTLYKDLLKKAKLAKSPKAVSDAFSAIDKAAKQNIIHKNKAARLKASLSKVSDSKSVSATVTVKTAKKPTKKSSTKKSTAKKAPSKKN